MAVADNVRCGVKRRNTPITQNGCSEARVAAIANMSPAMVHHFSKKVSQFRLARAAMEKFEAGWEKLRPSVLGSVKVVK